MAIDRNRIKEADIQEALSGSLWCMPLDFSDTEYFSHPDTELYPNKPIVTGAITFDSTIETGDVVMEFWNGLEFTFPAGSFVPQVFYPLHVVRISSTGTGVTNVLGWFGSSLRRIQTPQSLQLLATLQDA